MPSASSKPDKPAPVGVDDPLKQAIIGVEKKVRNIEKRKSKLDGYREKKARGETLNADQEEAVSQATVVDQNLTLTRELLKQFTQLELDIEKAARKQAKRLGFEQTAAELARCRETLILQATLDGMGEESVRPDFLAGRNGAVLLTEENLTQLDELYKLVLPSRESDSSFDEEVLSAAEHLQAYLAGSDKPVVGTTYRALKDMVTTIHASGYLDHDPEAAQEEEQQEEEAEPEVEADVVEEEPEQPDSTPDEDSLPLEPVISLVDPEPQPEPPLEDPQPELLPEQAPQVCATPPELPPAPVVYEMPQTVYAPEAPLPTYAPAPVEAYYPLPPRRDLHEIVAQGAFTFLQESEIECAVAEDPAVIAARPEPRLMNLPAPSEAGAALSFTSNFLPESDVPAPAAPPSPPQPDPTHVTHPQEPLPVTAPEPTPSYPAPSYPPPFPDIVDPTSAPLAAPTSSSPPAAIPMPPHQDSTEEQDKKQQYSMNPNAAIFHSMYEAPQNMEHMEHMDDAAKARLHESEAPEYLEQAHDFSAQQDYQSGFSYRGGRGGRGGGPRAGPNGYRGGGGPRGGQQAYPPRGGGIYNGQRGTSPRGGYNNTPGGYYGGGGRPEYGPRADAGYQQQPGFSNGYSGGNGGGYPRGGRGAKPGAARGGPARGAAAGGARVGGRANYAQASRPQ